MSLPRRVIVCGPPGAGKTTFVRERMEPGDLIVDLDLICQALTQNEDVHDKPVAGLEFALSAYRAIIRLASSGYEADGRIWVITTLSDAGERRGLAQRLDAHTIVLHVSHGTCVQRMRDQGRSSQVIEELSDVARRWHSEFTANAHEEIRYTSRETGADGWPA